jgi:endonuclease YncB( thermonuclease family)
MLAGPVAAEVVRTVDGDTLDVRAKVWLRQEITVAVRIRGIDAPERRARCPREKEMAEAATAALAAAVDGHALRLARIEDDKYGGRVLADVMLASGLVRPYQGGTREMWCGVAGAGG